MHMIKNNALYPVCLNKMRTGVLCLTAAVSLGLGSAAFAASATVTKDAEPASLQAQVGAGENETITQAMKDDFYRALSKKSSASKRTYDQLEPLRQEMVVRHYYVQGKSLSNIMMVLFQQLSAQIKTDTGDGKQENS